jgi:hypothetical protein
MNISNGELGILREVRLHEETWNKCFIVIDHNERPYMGCLLFDNLSFARQITQLLISHRGESIADIGSVDVSYLN